MILYGSTGGQQRQPPTAKIAVAVHDELGHVPTTEKVEQVLLRPQVREQAVLELAC